MSNIETYNALIGGVKEFNDLLGRILSNVEVNEDTVRLYLTENHYVELYHDQDCCESVYVEDVVGDVNDLVGEMLVEAEEVAGHTTPDGVDEPSESYTWTFYKFRTRKGAVTIRFLGESNGYYSESVDIRVFGRLGEDQ